MVVIVSPLVKANVSLGDDLLSSNSTIAAPPSLKDVAEATTAFSPDDQPIITPPTDSDAAIPAVRGATRIIVLLAQLPSDALIINLFG